ncbi:MAG TPA: crossover junction endodeoxyribonuclease RuvC [Candidatus Paceibacterota bacterium]
MRILAIDPGYERIGIAVLLKEKGGKEKYVFSECFKTPKELPHAERLGMISEEIKKVIEKWKPEALAIEKLFLATNHKTAMMVSEARGTVLSTCAEAGLKAFEYSPPQIKLAVCGDGSADKKSIIKMVPLLLQIPKRLRIDDEFDAIAVGLTFFAIEK